MFSKIFAILILLVFATAMTRKVPQAAEVPASPAPRAEEPSRTTEEPIAAVKLAWDGKHPDTAKWTVYLLSELSTLGSDILHAIPEDRKLFCPKFDSLSSEQRKIFYAQLISKMAEFESNYKPETFMTECSSSPKTYGSDGKFFASRGKWCIPGHAKDGGVAISRGLMQLSLESAQGYKCPISEPKELHDPFKNISCAVRIMNRFIPAPRQYEGKIRGHNRIAGKIDENWKGASAYWAVMRDSSGYAKESYTSIKTYVSNLSMCK